MVPYGFISPEKFSILPLFVIILDDVESEPVRYYIALKNRRLGQETRWYYKR